MENDRRIDFVIAGAQKSGTTTLDAILRAHPNVTMCRVKESHFFDSAEKRDYADYHRLFSPKHDGTVLGEATPSYLYVESAMKALRTYNENLKIIVVLRDPATRAYSHWNMLRQRNEIAMTFSEAIRQESKLINAPGDRETKRFAFLNRGRYVGQLKRMWSFFPPAQCLLLKYESVTADMRRAMTRILGFLGVDNIPLPIAHERSGVYAQKMSAGDLDFIQNAFADELSELSGMVDFDISDWASVQSG